MKPEMGSEFWYTTAEKEHYPVWEKYSEYSRLYMSGRGALYATIQDILSYRDCSVAYLPSYCCDSMVEPFLRCGISVEFYDVVLKNGIVSIINPSFSCDIILTVDYFGFSTEMQSLPDAVHIHDVTHSVLSSPAYEYADYYVGSLRKWGAVAGAGFAAKTNGNFNTALPADTNEKYLSLRHDGYALKEQYIDNAKGDKQIFLDKFSQAEELLEEDYLDYAPDENSVKCAGQIIYSKEKRTENAKIIYNGLRDNRLIEFVFPSVGENDVPLFVPVLVKNNLRNELRRHLIANDVYCPVHWPAHNGITGELYERELSLLCDQRYDKDDIQRQIDLINSFEESVDLI
ncbi:MAG: hypothetical protein E7218_04205 [Anaerofustis stercorihominis]|nr:hypothetical protein [Anaerofustis stercorihominis]